MRSRTAVAVRCRPASAHRVRTRTIRRPRAVAANGQPAFAGYLRGADGTYHAHAVQVLTLRAGGIAHVVSFNQPELFVAFGAPPKLATAVGMAGSPMH